MNGSPNHLDIWFIRHGQTDWNKQGRVQGASDADLNALGRLQAQALGRRLHGEEFDAVWSSDLRRARYTAGYAFPEAQLALDERLRELHAGDQEGLLLSELSPAALAVREAFAAGDTTVAAPGGESYGQVIQRVRSWLGDQPASGRVACVTHGGVVQAAVRLILGQEAGWRQGPKLTIANTSITVVRVMDTGYSLLRLNDHAHLEGLERQESDAAQARVEHVADSVAQ